MKNLFLLPKRRKIVSENSGYETAYGVLNCELELWLKEDKNIDFYGYGRSPSRFAF